MITKLKNAVIFSRRQIRKLIQKIGSISPRKKTVLVVVLLVLLSFYVGFLTGERELNKRIAEEIKEMELRIKGQSDDLQKIREDRGIKTPDEEQVLQQISDLEELRRKAKEEKEEE